ncbi:heterokaryon incompatibility protein-domain-containing protein [Daldinia decipiens]|uniref:heterokaryon incompatibility protein-domain-containing protein n=1 Tax=Daldinia decipiens TaxID=326647 RepID=UPI0020C48F97|nr:heterokaryon incompatibility protein-domain-containing protein [Daldinia decipiens]KAI1662973.1 heterokaryon incompatibility protein-domain-containing protein [Daldinia decipiens]
MGRERYSYAKLCPLDDPSRELRVLEIINNDSKTIEARLMKLRTGEHYNTLSWCWGESGKLNDAEIRIIQSNKSYTFPVPENLESSIRILRSHRRLGVWIDYICMDQGNIDEKKNYQVPMMASIYGQAECVFVWLGNEDENSELAIKFIQDRVLNLKDFDRLIRDDRTFEEWKDLADAISLFNEVEKGTRKVSEVMRHDRDLGHMPDFFGDVSELSATKPVEETNNLFRRLSGNERQAQFNLDYLVAKLTTFDSTEPRDTIYALLAIARDTVPVTTRLEKEAIQNPYYVDYSLPLSDVYIQFVKWAIERSNKTYALDIICRSWAPIPESSTGSDDDDDDSDDEERGTRWRLNTNTK